MDDVDLDLLCREADERVGERFDRAIDIPLDDDIELLEVAKGTATSQFVEGKSLLRAVVLLALELLTLASDATSFLLGVHHIEGLTSSRSTIQTEDQHGFAGACLLNLLVALIKHRLDTAVMRTGEYDITLRECTILHEDSSHIATPLVK